MGSPEVATAREGWRRTRALAGGGSANVVFTARGQGDFAVDQPDRAGLEARRRAVVDRPWVWLRQVHGAHVVVVADDGEAAGAAALRWAGTAADAIVTARRDLAVAVQTADCAPVALVSPEGVVAVVHAGWRGLEAGVVAAAVTAARRLGGTGIEAILGPCIHAPAYAFGEPELTRLASRFGSAVRGATVDGDPALDLPAAVDAALADADVGPAERIEVCTASSPDLAHSHRARRDAGRQATVAFVADGS